MYTIFTNLILCFAFLNNHTSFTTKSTVLPKKLVMYHMIKFCTLRKFGHKIFYASKQMPASLSLFERMSFEF